MSDAHLYSAARALRAVLQARYPEYTVTVEVLPRDRTDASRSAAEAAPLDDARPGRDDAHSVSDGRASASTSGTNHDRLEQAA